MRKVIRSNEVTVVVQLSWEELVIEKDLISALERLEVLGGIAPVADAENIDLLLHRDEVAAQKTVAANLHAPTLRGTRGRREAPLTRPPPLVRRPHRRG